MPVLVHIYRELSRKYNLSFATDEEILSWRSLSVREIMRRSGLSIFKVLPLLREGRKSFGEHLNLVKPVAGMPEVLDHLSKTHHLGIVTSNSSTVVEQFIKQHELPEFAFIYSDKTLFAKGAILRRVAKQYDFNPEATMYVGDEIRDIQAAKVARMPCLSVTWGLNSRESLLSHYPARIADTPDELLAALQAPLSAPL